MELKVLGSSSSGNCYILDNGKEALILEAGVRFKEVKKALGYNLRKVVGCLITHRHQDHAKYIKAMVDNGFYTLALPAARAPRGARGPRSVLNGKQGVYGVRALSPLFPNMGTNSVGLRCCRSTLAMMSLVWATS